VIRQPCANSGRATKHGMDFAEFVGRDEQGNGMTMIYQLGREAR
jgi:mannose/cellobiose epimerase-like protein (N-acyl-D-glucosamine 2-epimerase family)